MLSSRTATAAAGLLASLAVTLVLWWYFDTLLFLLVVPFVPFLFRNREQPPVRECPQCGFQTRDGQFAYCPRDGTRLEQEG